MVDSMSPAGLAQTLIASKTQLTQQELSMKVLKSKMDAQQSIVNLLTEGAENIAAAQTPSANSAITGRGSLVDITV